MDLESEDLSSDKNSQSQTVSEQDSDNQPGQEISSSLYSKSSQAEQDPDYQPGQEFSSSAYSKSSQVIVVQGN